MAIKDRSGGRNWITGLFAAFWILLAVFSGAYLFRIVTEPQAQRTESAVASPATTAATSAAAPPSPHAPRPAAPAARVRAADPRAPRGNIGSARRRAFRIVGAAGRGLDPGE